MDRQDLVIFTSVLVSVFMPIAIAFVLSGKQWKAAQDKAHDRRMTEHRLNARLLRFNI